MIARTGMLLVLGLALGAAAAAAQSSPTSPAGVASQPASARAAPAGLPDAAFQTVHLFNLADGDLPRLTDVLRQFNAVIVRLGHPEAKYRLWRLEGEAGARPVYLWQSTWPSRAAYDAVHADTAYQALVRAAFAPLSQLLKDHTYGQYRELPLEQPQP